MYKYSLYTNDNWIIILTGSHGEDNFLFNNSYVYYIVKQIIQAAMISH